MQNFKNKVETSSKFYNEKFLDIDFILTELNYRSLKQYFKGDIALELGPAVGQMTKYLINDFETLHVVEGSKNLLDQIPDYSNIVKHHCFFEEFDAIIKYDTIIMSHVLEHIENPMQVLKKFKNFLNPSGVLLISVPNAKSIHRLVAEDMKLIDSIYTLNARDHELGHYRVYDMESLKNDVVIAGYHILDEGGVFLKPISNKQIEESWTKEMIESFYNIGKQFSANCAEIYVILTH